MIAPNMYRDYITRRFENISEDTIIKDANTPRTVTFHLINEYDKTVKEPFGMNNFQRYWLQSFAIKATGSSKFEHIEPAKIETSGLRFYSEDIVCSVWFSSINGQIRCL